MPTPAPTTPAPTELAAEYREARLRMTELLRGADAEVAATRIPACPAWTVQRLCAHVTGIAVDLLARRNPGDDTQAWVDRQIAERADRSVAEVLGEWTDAGPAFEALIEAKPRAFGGLTYDVVVHEHDLRQALQRSGARSSNGVTVAMQLQCGILATDLDRHGLPALELVADDRVWRVGAGAPELWLDLGDAVDGTFELVRVLGSRRSRRQFGALAWQGDLERYLPALAHMPLPEDDLVE
jgi:uncharacterized protein (TIGR03083 family)